MVIMLKFSWSVQNFSLLNQRLGEYIDSPSFTIKLLDNKVAYLRLFPRGRANIGVVSCLLCFPPSQLVDLGTKVKLTFSNKIFFSAVELIANEKNKSDLRLTFQQKEYDEVKNQPMCDDNVVIECVIKKDCNDLSLTEIYCGKTVAHIEEHIFDLPLTTILVTRLNSWTSLHKFSKNITLTQQTEKLKLSIEFDDGEKSAGAKNYAFEISGVSQSAIPMVATFKLSFCSNEKIVSLFYGELFFKDVDDIWISGFDIKENDVSTFAFMRCELKLSNGTVTSDLETNHLPSETRTEISCIETRYKHDGILEHMYKNKKFCDVTLQVGDEQFLAHKCVLEAVSDVFAAMFEAEMKEKQSCVVDITDIDSATINKMLQFLYTGSTGNLDLEGLLKLYAASDKYQISNLKQICASELMMNVNSDNVCEILEIANLHQDSLLENFVRNFIYSNHKEICGSEIWKSFMEKRAKLAADVMLQISLRS